MYTVNYPQFETYIFLNFKINEFKHSFYLLRLGYSVSSLIIHEFGFCYIYVFINLLAMKYEKPIKLLSNVYFVVLHVNVSGNQSLTQPSSCSSSSASDFYYLQLLGSS